MDCCWSRTSDRVPVERESRDELNRACGKVPKELDGKQLAHACLRQFETCICEVILGCIEEVGPHNEASEDCLALNDVCYEKGPSTLRTHCEVIQRCILDVFGSVSSKGGATSRAHFMDEWSHNGEINIAGGQLLPSQGRVDRFLWFPT